MMSSKISNNEVIILQVKGLSQPLHICFTEECRRSFVVLSGLTICISIDGLASLCRLSIYIYAPSLFRERNIGKLWTLSITLTEIIWKLDNMLYC